MGSEAVEWTLLTALSHLVLALAQVTQAIALLEGILAYGLYDCGGGVVWQGELRGVSVGVECIADDRSIGRVCMCDEKVEARR